MPLGHMVTESQSQFLNLGMNGFHNHDLNHFSVLPSDI